MAETIENNVRRTTVDENPVNPKYYEQMAKSICLLIPVHQSKIGHWS